MSGSVLAVCFRPGVDPPWEPPVLSRKRALEQVVTCVPWFQDGSGARFRVFIYHLSDLWPTGSMVLDENLRPAPLELTARAVRTLWLLGLALKSGLEAPAPPSEMTRYEELSRQLREYLTEWQARVTGAGWPVTYREAFGRILDLVRYLNEKELQIDELRQGAREAARRLYERLEARGEEAVVTEDDPWTVLTPHIAALEIKRSHFNGELREQYMPAIHLLQGLRPKRPGVSRAAVEDLRRALMHLEGFLAGSTSLNLYPNARSHELDLPEAVIRRLVARHRIPTQVGRR
ncbi:hypothetical protein [Caldinitratiruptor microaerophilus]|uniref:Uncharacterized protein n=1 Tax=Caldinitratiruptor microaerophilus TaxID=671077 RepID=A0AA35CIN3_9FIRM|nr:hypothetical protein [Caldinitratiruptor microaerophilus]BDG59018.1 hypothetical protein caldi_01080 [Caldinitratiruptor microaerophilus]